MIAGIGGEELRRTAIPLNAEFDVIITRTVGRDDPRYTDYNFYLKPRTGQACDRLVDIVGLGTVSQSFRSKEDGLKYAQRSDTAMTGRDERSVRDWVVPELPDWAPKLGLRRKVPDVQARQIADFLLGRESSMAVPAGAQVLSAPKFTMLTELPDPSKWMVFGGAGDSPVMPAMRHFERDSIGDNAGRVIWPLDDPKLAGIAVRIDGMPPSVMIEQPFFVRKAAENRYQPVYDKPGHLLRVENPAQLKICRQLVLDIMKNDHLVTSGLLQSAGDNPNDPTVLRIKQRMERGGGEVSR